MSIDSQKKIIVDADVLIHFMKGDELGLLPSIFGNQLCIFKEVFDEVFKGKAKIMIENMIRFKQLHELSIRSDMQVFKEFASLKKTYGAGESACMAYCRCYKDVLASSNLKDIKVYCETHGIQYLTTMDFVEEAYNKGMRTEVECDTFISQVLAKNSRLPFKTMKEYLDNK